MLFPPIHEFNYLSSLRQLNGAGISFTSLEMMTLKMLFCCSVTQSCLTLWDPVDYSTLGISVPHHLLKFAQVHVHCISDAIQQSYPLMPSSAANFSSIRDFSNELAFHIGWPNYWSFSFSISPSNEYSRLISRKIDCFDLPAVQGTLGSLLHHHSLKASVLCRSAFFMVQLLQLYMTTENTITLTIQTFIGRVISLLFNNMSRFVITFLQRSNHLISQLQSLSAVILEPKKKKSVTTSTFSPSICHEWWDWMPRSCFVLFLNIEF